MTQHDIMDIVNLTQEATGLLEAMVGIPSVSREEKEAADLLEHFMHEHGLHPHRAGNNLWCIAPGFDTNRPTLLLNAHRQQPVVHRARLRHQPPHPFAERTYRHREAGFQLDQRPVPPYLGRRAAVWSGHQRRRCQRGMPPAGVPHTLLQATGL